MPQNEGHRGLLATGRNWGQAWSLQKEAPPLGFWTSGLPNCGRTSFCCSRYLLQRPDEANTEHGLPDSRCHGVTERLNKELRPKETRGHEDRAKPGFFRHRGSCGDSWPDLIVSEELLCSCSFRPCHDYVGFLDQNLTAYGKRTGKQLGPLVLQARELTQGCRKTSSPKHQYS